MTRKILFFLTIAGMAVASAKSFRVSLWDPALLGSTELKPGEYQVEVVDQKAILRRGKVRSEAAVKVENADTKYSSTSVRLTNGDGKLHIQEIHIGGTTTKLLFNE